MAQTQKQDSVPFLDLSQVLQRSGYLDKQRGEGVLLRHAEAPHPLQPQLRQLCALVTAFSDKS